MSLRGNWVFGRITILPHVQFHLAWPYFPTCAVPQRICTSLPSHMCSSNQYAWPYSPTCAVPARIWTSISWLIYAYLIYQNSKTWYLHAPHVNIYQYYYFSYSIQVRNASFLFSALLIKQGPLNIWTEHSNCQIHSRGDSKTPIASLIPNIFLIFYEIIFLCI